MTGRNLAAMAGGTAAVAAAVWLVTAPERQPPAAVAMKAERSQLLTPESDEVMGVCVLRSAGGNAVHGTLLFRSRGTQVEISGKVEGLRPGKYRFEVSEYGDARGAATGSPGGTFYPKDGPTRPAADELPLGDLLHFDVDAMGTMRVSRAHSALTLFGPDTLIGRGFALYEAAGAASSGSQVAFGVIGRANPDWREPAFVAPLTGRSDGTPDRC